MMALTRLLLVENEPKDLKIAVDVAREAGVTEIEARTNVPAARNYLEKGLRGEEPLPDGIVLDLDMGRESGYELLRLWHSTPRLTAIPILVWSVLGDEQRDMCKFFKVTAFVGKWEGPAAFREALEKLEPASQAESAS